MKGIKKTGIRIIGLTLLVLWAGCSLYNSFTSETSANSMEFQELVQDFERQTDFSNELRDPSNNFGRGTDFYYNSDEYLSELERITNLVLQMREFSELAQLNKPYADNASCLQNLLRGSYVVDFELQVISTYPRKTTIYLPDIYYYQVDRKLTLALETNKQLMTETKWALEIDKSQSEDRIIQSIDRTVKYMTEAVRLAQMAKNIEDSR